MKRVFFVLLTVLLTAALFAGGGGATNNTASVSTSSGPFSYPVPGNPVLSYFGQFHVKVMNEYRSYADLPIIQYWFKETGVKLDFNTPPAGMETEQLNIMLASGDLTDVICYNLVGMRGGAQKLHDDGIIIKLTDKLGSMPYMMKYFNENPDVYRQVKDDEGEFYVIPFIAHTSASSGTMLRGDILEELKLAPPETIDEWEKVLVAMKAAYPRNSPYVGDFTMLRDSFLPAFGLGRGYWMVDTAQKVRYTPLDPGYRDFITLMNKWYNMNLIDQNFATIDGRAVDNAMSSGAGFSTYRAGSSGVGAYMYANRDNPKYDIIGVRQPAFTKGEVIKYIRGYEFGGNPQVGISTKCKNVEAALRLYDFPFSPENYIKFNWGIEGESFIYVDGKPQYTDLILNNPQGLNIDTILSRYATTAIKGPNMMVQDTDYLAQYYNIPAARKAMEQWLIRDNQYRSFPPVSYTSNESSTLARVMADVETYVQQMSFKFILGTEPLSNWNTFTATINRMGIDQAIKVQQDSVDRYNKR